jgi:hypothetical protein
MHARYRRDPKAVRPIDIRGLLFPSHQSRMSPSLTVVLRKNPEPQPPKSHSAWMIVQPTSSLKAALQTAPTQLLESVADGWSPRTSSRLPLSSIHVGPADPTELSTPVPAPIIAERLLAPGRPRSDTDAVRDPPVRSFEPLVEGERGVRPRGIPSGGGRDGWV